MDLNDIVEVLRATLCPEKHGEGESQLKKISKMNGFAPSLVRVCSEESIELPLRLAAAVGLKNICTYNWLDKIVANTPHPHVINDADKAGVRGRIVEAIIQAPEPIRVQLAQLVRWLVHLDFPQRWPDVAEKARRYLMSDQDQTWMGALICIYQLAKVISLKKDDDLRFLGQAMSVLLPLCYQRMTQLMADQSERSLLLQKQILKIFHALTKVCKPFILISKEMLIHWIDVCLKVVSRPVPPESNKVDEHERPELPCWKTKKWAMHGMVSTFVAFGTVARAQTEFQPNFKWFTDTFGNPIIRVLLKVLDEYVQKQYVSPRMLVCVLKMLSLETDHQDTWDNLKPLMDTIIPQVIFPMVCHSADDDALWESDPIEYIKTRFDFGPGNDFHPQDAALVLLRLVCDRSIEMLYKVMRIIVQVMGKEDVAPREKAGALYMVAGVIDILVVRTGIEQIENLIVKYVLREFHSEQGYLRAIACWLMQLVHDLPYKDKDILTQACHLLCATMCGDKVLAVRLEAAIAVEGTIAAQSAAVAILKPHIQDIIQELVNIAIQIEQHTLMEALEQIISIYGEELIPVAVDICTHFAQMFGRVVESAEEKAHKLKVMRFSFYALDCILPMVQDDENTFLAVEGITMELIGFIYENNVKDLYDNMLFVHKTLTDNHISANMWKVFYNLYELTKEDEYFFYSEPVMFVLYNYITVDMQGFASNSRHLEIVYDICRRIIVGSTDDETVSYACKMLEVLLLQYKGQVDSVVPAFCELALGELMKMKNVDTPTLCVSYLQVLITALLYNPACLLDNLNKVQAPHSPETFITVFIAHWFKNMNDFTGTHGCKLCVLGLCCLLEAPPELRPPCLLEHAEKVIPAIIKLLKDLQLMDVPVSADISEEIDVDVDASQNEPFKTTLDLDNSEVNEFQVFKVVLNGVQQKDPQWFALLTSALTATHKEEVNEIFNYADQCAAEKVTNTRDMQ